MNRNVDRKKLEEKLLEFSPIRFQLNSALGSKLNAGPDSSTAGNGLNLMYFHFPLCMMQLLRYGTGNSL
jgi:hypothetical protein